MNPIFAPHRRCVMLGVMSKARESGAAARWRDVVRGHAESGLSVAAYCRRARVPASSFYAWRRKLQEGGTFTEVRVTPAPDPAAEPDSAIDHGALELHLQCGRRVIVRPGFDRQTLLDLLATLEADE
jgi:transposase-like protein